MNISDRRIRKAAVLGAGVMGAQIAAHLINAKVPVVLFDLPAKTDPKNSNAIVQQALDRLKTLRPAPLGINDDVQFIESANYDNDLDQLKDCDLVIEAIAERLDLKHALYQKVAPVISEEAIFASNTSGLSITALASALNDNLKSRFCGVHFFNPPRYMHLVELIPIQNTRADLLDRLETFLTSTLGKGVVRAKDTPNFIANRVGVFSMLSVIAEAQKFGLSLDLVDDLTGNRLGRAKSATFRTADIVGLDTMIYVIETMQRNLADDPFFPCYQTPEVLAELVSQGAVGQKSGAGFYKKEGQTIQVLDPQRHIYVNSGQTADALIDRILKRDPSERLQLLRESSHPQAQFLWAIFRDLYHYAAVHLEGIADHARALDFAVRWGFGWQSGPFESWQAAGWKQVATWINADIEAGSALTNTPLPDWVLNGPVAEQGGVHCPVGSWSPTTRSFVPRSTLAVYDKQVFHAPLSLSSASATTSASAGELDPLNHGQTLSENEAMRIWVDTRVGEDDVVIVSFKTKMNTISPAVLDGLTQAIDLAEKDYQGVVIWQPSSLKLGTPAGPFSAGADLKSMMPAFMKGGAQSIEPIVAAFQQTMLRVKYANVPVVSAISGLALGGGCELALASAARVAHVESYIGLVEAGVGLLPAGGGLKEMALRAACTMRQIVETQTQTSGAQAGASGGNWIEYLTKPLQNIGLAKVSGSAMEARAMGYLEPSDTIVFNLYELLDAARRKARALAAAGWRPPLRVRSIPVAGRPAIATFKAQLINLRDGSFISAHDFLIASRIAETLCGGDIEAGSLVDENWLLALERNAFIELLATQKTQERIIGMLQTGKPVRN